MPNAHLEIKNFLFLAIDCQFQKATPTGGIKFIYICTIYVENAVQTAAILRWSDRVDAIYHTTSSRSRYPLIWVLSTYSEWNARLWQWYPKLTCKKYWNNLGNKWRTWMWQHWCHHHVVVFCIMYLIWCSFLNSCNVRYCCDGVISDLLIVSRLLKSHVDSGIINYSLTQSEHNKCANKNLPLWTILNFNPNKICLDSNNLFICFEHTYDVRDSLLLISSSWITTIVKLVIFAYKLDRSRYNFGHSQFV